MTKGEKEGQWFSLAWKICKFLKRIFSLCHSSMSSMFSQQTSKNCNTGTCDKPVLYTFLHWHWFEFYYISYWLGLLVRYEFLAKVSLYDSINET